MRSLLLRLLYLLIVRPVLGLIIGVRFANQKVFKGLEQYIIVANHNSHFDTVSILAALPRKRLNRTHTVAAADYFGKSPVGRGLMKLFFNAKLIERDSTSALLGMDVLLKDGKSLLLFPEGTRGRPGVMADFKKGIAVLLQKNPGIPFIPVYLDGFGRVLPRDSWLVIPFICKVRFGEPVDVESKEIDRIIDQVRREIMKLRENCQRDRNRFKYEV